ncbi:hypothetical protein ED208_04120 [Stagnimonas aquatica]|uniref:Uncharacterized protein n=1 Tax=Stagnimonas aquatica TaxID=2689987 RepID=A0A3N0VLU2_9GAMM|nr:hypothetical protein [Stagnimonas aquatica]ROH93717.1 hypothetical protein ED208_04120 [Stagnimonas aquatica]
MKKTIAMALTALLALPARAQELTPAARLQFEFGGPRPAQGLRLRLLAETQDWRQRPGDGAPRLAVASVELSPGQAPYSTLLGLPLRSGPDRSQATGNRSGGHTWLWVGAGVVGTVAIAALAGGGSNKEVNNGNGCTVDTHGHGQCEVPGIPLPPILSGGS